MAKERQDYRANLEMLQKMFPGRMALSINEVCATIRVDRRTLLKDRTFPARMIGGKYIISITALARYLG